MLTQIVPFDFVGNQIRVIREDGEPLFVASDVASALGYRMASDLSRRIDDEDKGTRSVRTPGGDQSLTVITEAGLYAAILASQIPSARDFKRWVTAEVLPAIRKTGQFAVKRSRAEILAEAVLIAQDEIAQKDEQIAALAPKASAWDELVGARGDHSVSDASKILATVGIDLGPQKLFEKLGELGWTFRRNGGAWRPMQKAVDSGYLLMKPQSHIHPKTLERVIDSPQVRVTMRGLERLRVRLGKLELVAS